jgi:hypothetical protein
MPIFELSLEEKIKILKDHLNSLNNEIETFYLKNPDLEGLIDESGTLYGIETKKRSIQAEIDKLSL